MVVLGREVGVHDGFDVGLHGGERSITSWQGEERDGGKRDGIRCRRGVYDGGDGGFLFLCHFVRETEK